MSELLHFVLPGKLETLTGGYLYDRHIVEGLRLLGWEVHVHCLDTSFPTPTRSALTEASAILAAIRAGRLVVIDGLALGGMPLLIEDHSQRLKLIALVHHPLAAETGLDKKSAERLLHTERHALAGVQRVIVTSPRTAAALFEYGVGRARIAVVTPGTAARPRAPGSRSETVELLCVAGHNILLEALSQLVDRSWRLTCVGSLERSPSTTAAMKGYVTDSGLEHRVVFLGEMDPARLTEHYLRSDIFVLASHMEGYGMVLAEALSHGLPIVSTSAGAILDTVPAGAGILVPAGKSQALRDALADVMDNSGLRRQLADMAWLAGKKLPSWARSSALFGDELKSVIYP